MTTVSAVTSALPTDPVATSLPAEWEFVDCPMCGRSEFTPLIDGSAMLNGEECPMGVVRCLGCSLAWTNPRPTEQSIGNYYPDNYRPHLQPEKQRSRNRSRIMRLPDSLAPGRLLDFGCGAGQFLRDARDAGWTVQGVDLSERMAAELQQRDGITVHVGTLPHPDVPPHSFDVVSMWNSLEHTHHPRRVVEAARRLLRRNGRLLIGVPNFDSWAARTFGRHWFALDLPRHLVHFTPATLQRLLESEGFRVVSLEQVRRIGWLRHSARLAGRSPNGTYWSQLCQWKPAASMVARYAEWRGEADFLRVTAAIR